MNQKSFRGLLAISAAIAALTLFSTARHAQRQLNSPNAQTRPATIMARADPQMQAVLDQLAALGGKPIETLSPEQARRQPTVADAVKALLEKQGKNAASEPVGNVEDRAIPGPAGQIPVRIYTPSGAGPFPVVVYFHGGGWVLATIDTYDASARALTNAANAVVMSVEYRKAPEHKFPAAHEDAFAAYQWALSNAQTIGGDPERVAVAGESAGAVVDKAKQAVAQVGKNLKNAFSAVAASRQIRR